MPTPAENLAEIQRLLKNGETQAAADYAAKAQAEEQATADLAAGIKPPPPPPRNPDVIMVDFMDAVASRFGHHRELDDLVDEMRRALAPKPAETAEPAKV